MTTIREDVDNTALNTDEAAAAFLTRWTDAEKPSEDDEGAKPPRRTPTETVRDTGEDENSSEDDDDLQLEDDEEGSDEDDGEGDAPAEASDDAVVKLTVDGEEVAVSVKDLKRLYGQEASLTRKSQEVAQKRKEVEQEGARYVAATQKMMEKARDRFKPYAEIDWEIARVKLDQDEFIALRQEAKAAADDLRFLNEELDGVLTEAQKARESAVQEEAKAAVEYLTDPEKGIPNFNADVYQEMAKFAASQGIPEEAFAYLTDPSALKLIHMAMSYQRAKERAATKKKAQPTAKRTMKSSRKTNGQFGKADNALNKLRESGSRDDAVSAFMERWQAQGD